jgi:hypothetical protein
MIIIQACLIAFVIVVIGVVVEDYIKEYKHTLHRKRRDDE